MSSDYVIRVEHARDNSPTEVHEETWSAIESVSVCVHETLGAYLETVEVEPGDRFTITVKQT